MKKVRVLLAALVVATTFTSCEDDDDNGNVMDGNNSAYDLTVSNANFSILRTALERTGLDTTLDAEGSFTVFAPTNQAFTDFLTENNIASLDDVDTNTLRDILSYHVLGTVNRSAGLVDGYVKTVATNSTDNALDAYITTGTAVKVNDAVVDLTQIDIEVDNGVVHVMEDVIALPTVVTLAANNPAFGYLATALTQENLIDALNTTDGAPSPFTVFAPTNDSFQALIDADPNDGIGSVQDILDLSNLSDILTYHVVDGAAVRAEDITDGLMVDPLLAGTDMFTINNTAGVVITDGQGVMTNVTGTNVNAMNGVIHVIDFVLRP